MAEKIEFKKIREFGEIIGDTFLFIRQNFKPLMKAFLYLCGIFILGGILTMIMTQLQVGDMQENFRNSYNFSGESVWSRLSKFVIQYLFMMMFMMLSYTSVYVTVLSYVALYIQKGNVAPNVEEVWSYYKYYFFRMFGSGIVISIFLVFCFACCFFPGVYVFPAVSIMSVIMVIENASLGYSFNRSFKLLRNEWWATAGVLIVVSIITYACTLLVQLPATIIAMVSAFTHAEQRITKTYAIVASISQYLSQIFLIIPILAATLIYFNLVERKESTGLLDRIDGLGKGPEQFNSTPEEY
ncbi:hypothetical protein DHW03_10915 [Pedobacter yonginense]|uniref:Glycerophosphoryl diester phosphodiesterase membrane domain-containing protein n=1 Tax=Pedobacter yonginense TaxID=651869 RepID=A0A317EMM5_9SPHI|nr:hypothetical protein [Pedobacter yonginense]PWS28061.1 hypothetical protein DHW03_10915 [Pedobacter yonginense]